MGKENCGRADGVELLLGDFRECKGNSNFE